MTRSDMYAYPGRQLSFGGAQAGARSIEGKWPMRRTLLFVTASSIILWAALITFIASL